MNASEIVLRVREVPDPEVVGGTAYGIRLVLALAFGVVGWSEFRGRTVATHAWSIWTLLASGVSLSCPTAPVPQLNTKTPRYSRRILTIPGNSPRRRISQLPRPPARLQQPHRHPPRDLHPPANNRLPPRRHPRLHLHPNREALPRLSPLPVRELRLPQAAAGRRPPNDIVRRAGGGAGRDAGRGAVLRGRWEGEGMFSAGELGCADACCCG